MNSIPSVTNIEALTQNVSIFMEANEPNALLIKDKQNHFHVISNQSLIQKIVNVIRTLFSSDHVYKTRAELRHLLQKDIQEMTKTLKTLNEDLNQAGHTPSDLAVKFAKISTLQKTLDRASMHLQASEKEGGLGLTGDDFQPFQTAVRVITRTVKDQLADKISHLNQNEHQKTHINQIIDFLYYIETYTDKKDDLARTYEVEPGIQEIQDYLENLNNCLNEALEMPLDQDFSENQLEILNLSLDHYKEAISVYTQLTQLTHFLKDSPSAEAQQVVNTFKAPLDQWEQKLLEIGEFHEKIKAKFKPINENYRQHLEKQATIQKEIQGIKQGLETLKTEIQKPEIKDLRKLSTDSINQFINLRSPNYNALYDPEALYIVDMVQPTEEVNLAKLVQMIIQGSPSSSLQKLAENLKLTDWITEFNYSPQLHDKLNNIIQQAEIDLEKSQYQQFLTSQTQLQNLIVEMDNQLAAEEPQLKDHLQKFNARLNELGILSTLSTLDQMPYVDENFIISDTNIITAETITSEDIIRAYNRQMEEIRQAKESQNGWMAYVFGATDTTSLQTRFSAFTEAMIRDGEIEQLIKTRNQMQAKLSQLTSKKQAYNNQLSNLITFNQSAIIQAAYKETVQQVRDAHNSIVPNLNQYNALAQALEQKQEDLSHHGEKVEKLKPQASILDKMP